MRPTSSGNYSANRRTGSWDQEVAGRDLSIRPPLALNESDVHALEAGVGPLGAAVPRVAAGGGGLEADLVGLGGAAVRVEGGDVLGEGACNIGGTRQLEADAAIFVGRVTREGEGARLLVVREALGEVAECDTVGHDVVGLGRATAAQLEPVAVALERAEVPPVESVAPRDRVLNCDWRCEFPVVLLISVGSLCLRQDRAVMDWDTQ